MSDALRIAHGAFGRVALLDMDRPLVRHAHPHCHVLLKVEGADTHFIVGNDIAPLTSTNAVLIDGWKPHAYVHQPGQPRSLILALYIEPNWLKEFRPGWAASGAPGFFGTSDGEISPRIRTLTLRLAADMMSSPERTAAHEATLSDLMVAVIERFTRWRASDSLIRNMSLPAFDRRIRKAAETIRSQEGPSASMDDIARQSGLSRAHFFRLFESSIGVPPRVFSNVVRMEKAVAAVLHQDAPVAEISDQLGFPEPSHFTRFFTNHAGVGPREFRTVSRLAS
ncbi:MAG: helix-turn-helix transcriptional regulator [Xanthobacteraceae bacterium]|nr:helix-turn-helix transcriptional regulator [Xanthobacteraceae bacterium]